MLRTTAHGLAIVLLVTWNADAATLAGCDYWDKQEYSSLADRLESSRSAYWSIPNPSEKDLQDEYDRMWAYYEAEGHDPAYQMKFADADWLARVHHGRLYKERVGFVPTHEEFWVYCLDTRLGRRSGCEELLRSHGQLSFGGDGSAVEPPAAFLALYDEQRDKFFEHVFLASIIIDGLSNCDESEEASALIDKAFDYINNVRR
ncbi:hypothetical protein [Nitratireductor luteus]|uniref:hypothetical protein n=1 Tax=Nitratireductor luteus TaxID=2976980 RepID=UPI00223F890E|nr:hypothetical protein [Nitratireductor luteus]